MLRFAWVRSRRAQKRAVSQRLISSTKGRRFQRGDQGRIKKRERDSITKHMQKHLTGNFRCEKGSLKVNSCRVVAVGQASIFDRQTRKGRKGRFRGPLSQGSLTVHASSCVPEPARADLTPAYRYPFPSVSNAASPNTSTGLL